VRFQLTGGNPEQYPPAALMAPDADALELASDIVWWRRLAYFATLMTTLVAGLFFAALLFDWPKAILSRVEMVLVGLVGNETEQWLQTSFASVGSGLTAIMPGWLAAVLPEISSYPLTAVVSVALLATLFFGVSRALQRRIAAFAEWAWGDQKGLPNVGAPTPNWLNRIARPGRKVSGWIYRVVWLGVIVNGMGIAIGMVFWLVALPVMKVRELRRRPWLAERR
jgi:hypothetical protein